MKHQINKIIREPPYKCIHWFIFYVWFIWYKKLKFINWFFQPNSLIILFAFYLINIRYEKSRVVSVTRGTDLSAVKWRSTCEQKERSNSFKYFFRRNLPICIFFFVNDMECNLVIIINLFQSLSVLFG